MTTTTLTEEDLAHSPVDLKLLSDADKKELIVADTASISSGTTLGASLTFAPTKTLTINTKGTPVLRLPLPLSELQIPIHNSDGSAAYLSTRERRSSGNCVLTDAEGKEIIQTTYFFGPGRDPVLHFLSAVEEKNNEIKTLSKWTSRSQRFVLPDGRELEWEYKREKGFGGPGKNGDTKKGTALVLSMAGRRLAALIRNDETRTPGSKSCSAGNGGELVFGNLDGLDEAVVVATCLLMLKKEVDRRRTVQIMMITAAISGGS